MKGEDGQILLGCPTSMEVKLDLLIAAASAGVLVYGGRLSAPTARLRPEDIIAYESLPEETLTGGMVPFLVFREDVLRKSETSWTPRR